MASRHWAWVQFAGTMFWVVRYPLLFIPSIKIGRPLARVRNLLPMFACLLSPRYNIVSPSFRSFATNFGTLVPFVVVWYMVSILFCFWFIVFVLRWGAYSVPVCAYLNTNIRQEFEPTIGKQKKAIDWAIYFLHYLQKIFDRERKEWTRGFSYPLWARGITLGGRSLTLIRTPLILILRDFILFCVYLPTLMKESVLNPIFVYNSYYNTLL
jgi:hypothetical protein